MSLLAAIAVTLRVMIIMIALAMDVGWWDKFYAVVMQKRGWRAHLSSFVVMVFANGAAIGSSVNMFPDAGWEISETFRLFILDFALGLVVVALLTAIYRRALRSGPAKARKAIISGAFLLVPAIGFVVLLTLTRPHG